MMQEDFLHYLWKYKKIELTNLKTVNQELIVIESVGEHNQNTGPDFFNGKIKIDNQLWAGNIEIHVKSGDWYLHNHETDTNYDNVILHVVWEHDAQIFRKDNTEIPTLALKHYISKEALDNYKKLFGASQKWINCQSDLATVNTFTINNWLERLYLERLEGKAQYISSILEQSKNDWEAVLFKLLAKNFGLKVNKDSFAGMANSFDFSTLRKQQFKLESLEALFFGQTELLNEDIQEPYYLELQKEYQFLKQKFNLSSQSVPPLQFFRLRPANFPTIRLSQLANVYYTHKNLFSRTIETQSLDAFYELFTVGTSTFWDTHYTFNKTSKASKKKLTKAFVNLLLINTIIPIQFSYAKQQGKTIEGQVLSLIEKITSEKNSVVEKFNDLKPIAKSALQSQAIIQLKTEYCNKNKCLQCAIGNAILSNKKL